MAGKESICFQKFRNRIENLKQYLQVFTAAIEATNNLLANRKNKNELVHAALGLDANDYSALNHPIKGMNIVFGHTKSKSGEFSYVELYNAFSAYMRGILKEMYRKEPTKIIHKAAGDKTIPFSKISELKTFENIENYVVESVFRKLEEERSTLKLLNRILEHTKVTIDESIKTKGLMYLEMRHLFIHNDGQADADFITKYSSVIKLKQDTKTQITKLPTDFIQVYTAIESVQILLAEIDKQLLSGDFIDPRKYAPIKQK